VRSSGLEATLQRAWLRRGALALALWPLSMILRLLVGLRKSLYMLGLRKPVSLPVPVVVVGNLIAGGAGKTPTVIAVVRCLQAAGRSPGVISRGYGRQADAPPVLEVQPDSPAARVGDEPLLLRLRLKVPVFVGADRVAVASALLRSHPGVDVLVSDDGLQHLRLPRAAQVVVFDERGAGNGWMLPAGPLREPLAKQAPPQTVILQRAAAHDALAGTSGDAAGLGTDRSGRLVGRPAGNDGGPDGPHRRRQAGDRGCGRFST